MLVGRFPQQDQFLKLALLAVLIAVLIWSGIGPTDRFTWALEVLPVVAAIGILLATNRRFPLSPLSCWAVFLFGVILCIGGHWTYAEVPAGLWVRDALGLSRNHYDRLGHFAQGFFPAILTREVLLRTSPLRPGKWLGFLVSAVCLAISASFEFCEWAAALATGSAADAYLATQGDPWDTQWDMFLALIGSILAQLFLRNKLQRQLWDRGWMK